MNVDYNEETAKQLSDMVQDNLSSYWDKDKPEIVMDMASQFRQQVQANRSILDICPEYLAMSFHGIIKFQDAAIVRWEHWLETLEFPPMQQVLATVECHDHHRDYVMAHKDCDGFVEALAALFNFHKTIKGE